MKKWNSLYNYFKTPLQLLFFVFILRSLGHLILNPYFSNVDLFTSGLIYDIAQITVAITQKIIRSSPIILAMYFLAKRHSNSLPSMMVVISFYIVLSIQMYYRPDQLSSLSHTITNLLDKIESDYFVSGIVIFLITVLLNYLFLSSRRRSDYSFLSFISKNNWFILTAIISSFLLGFTLTYLWPFIFKQFAGILLFISEEITNPISLFLYGIIDRIMSLVNLEELIKAPFYYDYFGGSWMDSVGTTYYGDANIWEAQSLLGIFDTGAGRFVTPYYILNLFAIPGFVISYYRKTTNKIEQKKLVFIVIIVILFSLLGDTLILVELMLLIMAPVLFCLHILYVGILFAVLEVLQVFIGYNTTASDFGAVGNIFDFISSLLNSSSRYDIIMIGLIAIITFFVYYLLTDLYFKYLSLDFFNLGRKTYLAEQIIDALGGTENINMITCTPVKLMVQINDSDLLELYALEDMGAFKITETRIGYNLYFGLPSYALEKEIKNQLLASQ